ncbi:MAG: aminotransferase class V-fold PLP-dependent enzyme, partial [Bacteroidota bacterium]
NSGRDGRYSAQVQTGDHIVCVKGAYSWTNALLTKFLARFQVSHSFVDGRNIAEIEAAIQPNTKVLILESPNSVTFHLQDLEACARLAQSKAIVTIIDNSYCSPIFQQPARFGIDLIVHSGTKYINGHSDVVLGVACGSKAQIKKIFESELMTLGAILSPSDAALAIRGLRTLPLRMQQSQRTAAQIIAYLQNHPKVEKVLYPFSEDFPQRELARKQMSGAGGLFSVLFKAQKMEQMEDFFHRLNRFLLAVSWGGHESLVLPFCAFYGIPGREAPGHPWNLVRFYVGLEEADWLIEDLEQAMGVLG